MSPCFFDNERKIEYSVESALKTHFHLASSAVKNVTLDDVAKKAGVSRATVSRVVNHYPHVSDRVRQRVLAVIEELGYNPNIPARSLASRRTGNIGFVIPNSLHTFFTDPYFPRLIEGIVHACNENDYTLSLFVFHTPEMEERLIPRLTRGGFVDGIIVQATDVNDTVLRKIAAGRVPFVVAGRPVGLSGVSYIDVDNVKGAYNAVAHLIRTGRKHIGTITGPLNTAVGADRLEGYRRALADRNRPVEERLVAHGDFTQQSSYYAARQLLADNPDLDALFVASDTMAVGALQAIREAGKTVPADVAIVGYDDLPPARLAEPPLTTIRQPIKRFGRHAMEILMDIIANGPNPPRQVVMETELVIRKSCGSA
ncbi:MAG: LacI family transcriptional regulator [Caldilineae bacterium]|nr:MAG: LacI family transcriptional regulator [Caldilineae bacterium]